MNVYTNADVTTVRTDQLQPGDLVARGRDLWLGGYTGTVVARAGWAGRSKVWQSDVYRVELVDGTTFVQPGKFAVTVVAEAQVTA